MPSGINLTNINNGSIKVQSVDASVNNYVLTLPAVTDTLAGLTSPAFIGIPTAPTTLAGTNTTQLATTAFVNSTKVTTTPITATGTSIDFTGIPSWVKRITVMLNGISTNGASIVAIQLGTSAGIATTGYLGSSLSVSGSTMDTTVWTTLIPMGNTFLNTAATVRSGAITVTKGSDTTYFISGNTGHSNTTMGVYVGGSVTLSAIIDRIRITTAGGVDLFDAGSINIMYEG